MPLDPANQKAYKETFFPYAAAATDRILQLGGRLAYYTTAATAIQILRSKEIWMRNTMVMNDFMEVEHGLSCIIEAYKSSAGAKLDAALESCFPGVSAEIKSLFNAWIPGFRRDTFVACFSEHIPDDDLHGRLSMWRAYGGVAGVALVINGGVMFRPSTALATYSSPVAYLNAAGVQCELAAIAARVQANTQLVLGMGREGLKNAIFHMLRFGAVCTKHPAFREEREWRAVASPALESSPLLQVQVEIIGGIPQKVLKIKLNDHPDKNIYGLELTTLIERVLIGPCEQSDVIGQALWQALADAGVQQPETKIVHTGIPLRANQR